MGKDAYLGDGKSGWRSDGLRGRNHKARCSRDTRSGSLWLYLMVISRSRLFSALCAPVYEKKSVKGRFRGFRGGQALMERWYLMLREESAWM